MAKLKDKLWLWGHPEGKYNNDFGNREISRMSPLEGALYLDCTGIFMVPVDTVVNRRQYLKSFKPMDRVGWDVLRTFDGDAENGAGANPELVYQLIEDAKEFKNITCAVFDDFAIGKRYTLFPIENMYKVRDILHNNEVRPLDMWMVLYSHEFGENEEDDKQFLPYAEAFDGIIMWTWEEKEIVKFEEKFKLFKEITKNKKRMLGLYLYNFGEHKKATGEAVIWQLNRYYELLKAGEVEGIVLHTNTMADLEHESYDVCLKWLAIHANDEI